MRDRTVWGDRTWKTARRGGTSAAMWLSALATALPAAAAITNVRVVDTTPMQAVIAYTASDTAACSMEVSESATYSPVVRDVDGTKLRGAALDSRTGNLSQGRSRVFVVGKRAAEKALDGRFYSRALQAYTLHYYRITCGSDTSTGTFRTANIPLGNTYPEPYPVDPGNPGQYAWPNQHFDQQQENFVDPTTGALIHRMTGLGSLLRSSPFGPLGNLGAFDDSGASPAWSTTSSALPATYTANGGATPSKLFVPVDPSSVSSVALPPTTIGTIVQLSYITVNLTGTATGTVTGDKSVTMCLTVDGVNCVAGAAQPTQDLSACASGCTLGNTTVPLNYWFGSALPTFNGTDIGSRATTVTYDNTTGAVVYKSGTYFNPKWTAGSRAWIGTTPYRFSSFTDIQNAAIPAGLGVGDKALTGQNFGVLVWKSNNTTSSSVTLTKVQFTFGVGYTLWFWDQASQEHCHPQLLQRASSGSWGYHCVLQEESGNALLAWIDRDTADTRLLRNLALPSKSDASGNGWSGSAYWTTATFDHNDPNVMYVLRTDQNGKRIIVRVTYSGDNSGETGNVLTGDSAASTTWTSTNLTPYNPSGEHYDLGTLIHRFDANFDPTYMYWNTWALNHVTPGGKLAITISRGQDYVPGGWIVVFDPTITPDATHNPVIAAVPTAARDGSYSLMLRWGVYHSISSASEGWFGLGINQSTSTDLDLFRTTLAQALDTSSTTVYTAGEPGSGVWDIARVGDVFQVDSEMMKITAKVSSTEWQVQRGIFTTVSSHAQNANALFQAGPWSTYQGATGTLWNWAADPHGTNAAGNTVAVDAPYYVAGHGTLKGGKSTLISESAACHATMGDGSYWCADTKVGYFPEMLGRDADTHQSMFLPFAGKRAYTGGYESHMSRAQWLAAPAWEQDWVIDSHPLDVGSSLGATFTKIGGTAQLYQASQTWNRKHVPVLAACGTHPLKDISGPTALIQDGTAGAYTYCIASNAGECRSGSTTTSAYVNCPNIVAPSCTTDITSGQASEDICVYEPVHIAGVPVVQRSTAQNDRTGNLSTRVLARAPERWRRQWRVYTSNGKALPGGEWILYWAGWVDDQYSTDYAVKAPPFPGGDSANRATFMPVTVQVNSVPAGTDNVVAEFGYDTNFYCTSRLETCVANGTGQVNETTPFAWASESYSGLSCAAGCTLTIPALPQRVLYYRLKYRNAGGGVIMTGPARVAVTP
jgi:hypothetical protein